MSRSPSIVTKSPAALTVARPVVAKHPLWRPGCKALVDFCDTFGANTYADGAIATGSVMQDLLETPNVVTVSSTVLSNATGKAGLVSTGAAGTISIGAAGACAVPTGNKLMASIWIKQPSSGFNPANFVPLFYLGSGSPTNGNACQFFMDMGSGGATPRMQIGTGAATLAQVFSVNSAQGAPTLFSLYYDPIANLIQSYRNGVIVGVANPGGSIGALLDASAMTLRIDTRFIGTIYGCSLFDITTALATEATWGVTSMTVAEHVAAEYAFGVGTLTGSPRVAYA